eukprot:TRINITY_DN66766_c4_g1_i1.p1 TRINITY_DN66766_c4_g1~~TRINITY_DN66766_c4_g1_i1.p1  ORF type:complete len:387 (+),score=189.60 TRINITY_DN66766_c4_g1_i1:33-1193(+)
MLAKKLARPAGEDVSHAASARARTPQHKPDQASSSSSSSSATTVIDTTKAAASSSSKATVGFDGVQFGAWRFQAVKRSISSSAELEALEKETGIQTLPEMVFGNNIVRVDHEPSGFSVSFRTDRALIGCLLPSAAVADDDRGAAETQKEEQESKTPAAVTNDSTNSASSSEQKKNKKKNDCDKNNNKNNNKIVVQAAKSWEKRLAAHPQAKMVEHNFDWTYTTKYSGTHNVDASSAKSVSGNEWKPVPLDAQMRPVDPDGPRINMELLKRRDAILWYQDIPLFDDELHDNGESSLSVKVRVMPSCFLLLARFWLRVDGVLLRSFETRIFHEFGRPWVVREITSREESLEALVARGMPADMKYYREAQSIIPRLRPVEYRLESISLS